MLQIFFSTFLLFAHSSLFCAYQTDHAIAQAFDALARHDHTNIRILRDTLQIAATSKNSQGTSFLQRILEARDYRVLSIILYHGFPGVFETPIQPSVLRACTRTDTPYFPLEKFVLDWISVKPMPEDLYELKVAFNGHRPNNPLDKNEMLALSVLMAITPVLETAIAEPVSDNNRAHIVELSAPDHINPYPYFHERAWLQSAAAYASGYQAPVSLTSQEQENHRAAQSHTIIKKVQPATDMLFPYLSARAFECIDYNDQWPLLFDYFTQQKAAWHAMRKKRAAALADYINPCQSIVQEYLEGIDEYPQIRNIARRYIECDNPEQKMPAAQNSKPIALLMEYLKA